MDVAAALEDRLRPAPIAPEEELPHDVSTQAWYRMSAAKKKRLHASVYQRGEYVGIWDGKDSVPQRT